MDLLYMIEPWHWLVLGFVLMIAEIVIPTFASLWFGAAAVIVALLSWLLPIPVVWQILIWLALSVLFMFAWVKYIKPLSINRRKIALDNGDIIGETGMIVVKPTASHLGRVRFNVPIFGADEWFCRTDDDRIEAGDRVVVIGITGNELTVSSTQQTTLNNQLAAPQAPNIPNIIPTEQQTAPQKSSARKLHLDKPSLDSVRLNKKFTDK